MPWLFLFVSLIGAWLTYNTYRPTFTAPRRSVLSFVAGWLTSELAVHHIVWQAVMTLVFVWAGALRALPGWLGLLITGVSWLGLWRCYRRGHAAEAVVEHSLLMVLGPDYRERILPEIRARFAPDIDWRHVALPFPMRRPEVERVRNIVFAEVEGVRLRLDVYRHQSCPTGCPVLLQLHGGGWVIGTKNEQAIPLMQHLASRGWVCVSADYRLSPRATFPDHLIDCKRALAWIRSHGAEYGADPGFVVVTGGSAGGHLAALMALTANDPEYQPGFETVDTGTQACVAFYGVYDFMDREGFYPHDALQQLLERRVMKVRRADAPDAFRKASPVDRIHPGAPPFFIIHGDLDTLVPVDDARRFAALLRETSRNPVLYAEIPGAQHAFDVFPSVRTLFVIHGIERFVAAVYSDHLRARRAAAA